MANLNDVAISPLLFPSQPYRKKRRDCHASMFNETAGHTLAYSRKTRLEHIYVVSGPVEDPESAKGCRRQL